MYENQNNEKFTLMWLAIPTCRNQYFAILSDCSVMIYSQPYVFL